jgi:hypothetical protein
MLLFLSDEHALMNKAVQTLKYIKFFFIEVIHNKKVIENNSSLRIKDRTLNDGKRFPK